MILRNTTSRLLIMTALWAAACGSNTSSDDDTETDTTTDTTSLNDGGMGTDGDADVCADFHNYAEGCELSAQMLMIMDLICSTMDSVFTDSLLRDTMDCFTAESCEEFTALISSLATDTDTEPDAGTPDNSFSECAESTMLTAEPEPANEDFQEHFCDWVMQCDEKVSDIECARYFTDPDSMLLFTVLEDSYIEDADACVYPMPSCTDDDVAGCLEEVITQVSSKLNGLPGLSF